MSWKSSFNSILGRGLFCYNDCLNAAWHGGDQFVAQLRWYGSPGFLFLFGSQRRWSLSLLVLTLIFPALLPCLVRDSLCTALQTKILWINRSLNAIDTIETWVSGNLTALTERSQPAIRWTRGRGGESCVWRLFPWRTLISTFSEP